MGFVRKLLRKIGLWRRKIPLLWRLVRFDPTLAFGSEEFRRLYAQAEPRTLVGKARCLWLWRLAKFTAGKEGEIAEVGVYKGGTARILARACPQKTVHLFDTFAGMPEVRPEIDSHKPGDFGDKLRIFIIAAANYNNVCFSFKSSLHTLFGTFKSMVIYNLITSTGKKVP